MIKMTGNIKQAIKNIEETMNAASEIYPNATNGKGILEEAVFTVKTNFATKTGISTGSSKILDNFKPGYEATVISKLTQAGAALVAKTQADELGLGGTGLNSAYGIIKNPLDENRMVGGSSSGAAASLKDGITFAIGSDTGDSVRTPTSFVGKVGFKPSYGAISRYGLFAFSSSLDTVGFLAHNVNDVIIGARAAYGLDQKDMTSRDVAKPEASINKPKKITVIKNLIEMYSDEYKTQFYALIEKLKDEDIEIIEKNIDQKLLDSISIIYQIISFSEASSNLANLNGISFTERVDGETYADIMTNTRSHKFGMLLQRRLTLGAYFLSTENQIDIFQRAQKVRRILVNKFNEIYKECDFILSIATPIAPLIEEGKKDTAMDNFMIHSNFEGTPSITLPFAKVNNMPFGIVLDSKIDSDKELLSNALFIEKIIGGKYD